MFLFLAVAAFVRLIEEPSPGRALGAAVLFGLANLAKFTALLLGPLTAGLAALACLQRRSLAPARWTLLVWFGGLGVFAAGYGFEARSVNQAWAEPQYVTELVAPPVHDVRPEHLAAEGRAAGLPEGAAQQLERAPGLGTAVEYLGAVLGGPDAAAADAALEALRVVRLGSSGERKHAFAVALEAEGSFDEERRLDLLAELGDAHLPDREAWRAWFAQSRHDTWDRAIFTQGWIETLTRGVFGDSRPIPLFSALKGIDYQLYHGQFGHTTSYRGETLRPQDFQEGNPYPEYYADVLWIKNPLPWLLLCGLGLLLSFWLRRGWGLVAWVGFAGFPLVLFLTFSRSNALLGIRYILPVMPFLALLGGRVAVLLPRAAPALAGAAALLGLWIHPHQLMYYNFAAGGPWRGPSVSVASDDWGQGARELGRFYARHREAIEATGGLHWDPYFKGDLAALGLEQSRPVQGQPSGIVAVNAIHYWREREPGPGWPKPRKYAWLDEYEPFARLDWSISLYDTRPGAPGGDPLEDWEAAAQR